ncbi:frnE protein [Nostoc sp. 'Peltigera membranacea cyanobiont' 213]|uniref:DsbA family oxidoreductase n=1 Tax=Nostoc sp. 'Peltigera membranacea cyanobiont' 213 TaxID=2014530 RepID=UPI000B956EA8|nr:DsbA family oxidoreductase [Nostoc sp. 'Peltigera membranacea cyanobiont' 213]OYD93435.1 frnE protein [Nostoc sp. 'Peltigera membranacea cyanobiont' 213]
MLIDIFHDTVCPWCRIGKKHLFDALAQWQEQEVHIRWHPFLLDNTVPAEGYEFRSFMQNRKGIKASEMQQIFDYTQRAGEAAGVKLDFDKIRLAVNTQLSHQLIALAPANVKNNVVEAIYRAYFEKGLNIGDINVIVAIGTAYQMDSTELKLQLNNRDVADVVVTESEFARLNGINSVPFFIMNNQVKVNGSHSVEVFLEALNRAALLDIPAKI